MWWVINFKTVMKLNQHNQNTTGWVTRNIFFPHLLQMFLFFIILLFFSNLPPHTHTYAVFCLLLLLIQTLSLLAKQILCTEKKKKKRKYLLPTASKFTQNWEKKGKPFEDRMIIRCDTQFFSNYRYLYRSRRSPTTLSNWLLYNSHSRLSNVMGN